MIHPDSFLPSDKTLQEMAARFPFLVKKRPEQSNKGTFGTLAVLGSGEGMSGAVVLAGTTALKTGTGKVFLGFNQKHLPMALISNVPELMLKTADTLMPQKGVSAWVMGCGLGLNQEASQCLDAFLALRMLSPTMPVLLDADALTLLATRDNLPLLDNLVLTPHPGEAARLLHTTIADIQAHREASAQKMAKIYRSWVVLKGHHTVIASPEGDIYTNETGNAVLATAGSGDVLSGIIGSLLAQACPIKEAVLAGVWLHGAAADICLARGQHLGVLASELIDDLRLLRNALISFKYKTINS